MRSFQEIYDLVCEVKGGTEQVESGLPKAKSSRALSQKGDNFFLSNMCLRVFRAGLKHSMVDGKWPAFEQRFKSFDPFFCAMLSEDDIDEAMQDTSIIRHRGKLNAIQKNAQFVVETSREYDGFGRYLAKWPAEDTVGLWWELKKRGKQLGGNSGPYFLRMVGKDTFLFTRDVVAVLKTEGVLTDTPTAKRDMLAGQGAFLEWHQESGRPFCEISRIVSMAAT